MSGCAWWIGRFCVVVLVGAAGRAAGGAPAGGGSPVLVWGRVTLSSQ